MSKLYFENVHTKRRFEIVRLNRETNRITLRGQHAMFDEDYDKDRFQAMGYRLVQGEDQNAEQP